MEDVEKLLAWAACHGSSLHSTVEVYQDEITGLSFRASNDISKGTELAISSYATTISWLNIVSGAGTIRREQPFPVEFVEFFSQNDPHVLSHFFLMQQYLLQKDSFWWPYLETLPQPDEISIPTLWHESDQRCFNGTNVEPALKKRIALWKVEWNQAKTQLDKYAGDSKHFYFELYQWAAAIFGSRSFRPSLTISSDLFEAETDTACKEMIQAHINNDRFSILFPVLDIGNHNSVDRVLWNHTQNSFSFSSLKELTKGGQIYNYYGNKSNSELLVAYGFLLDNPRADRANIKLNNLPLEVQEYHRSQRDCGLFGMIPSEEEFMFHIGISSETNRNQYLSYISPGFFNTVMFLVANNRERQFLSGNIEYSPEHDSSIFTYHLARCAYIAAQMISQKIQVELDRLENTHPGSPQNPNQETAIRYRTRTKDLLISAHTRLTSITPPPIIQLKTAYLWLKQAQPTLYTKIETFIAKDQEEDLPLDWDILVEDWDHTYLLVWLYIILNLHQSHPKKFGLAHGLILEKYIADVIEFASADHLHAEAGEIETINTTVDFVAHCLGEKDDAQKIRLRNLASDILRTESVKGLLRGHGDGSEVEQECLCVPIL